MAQGKQQPNLKEIHALGLEIPVIATRTDNGDDGQILIS